MLQHAFVITKKCKPYAWLQLGTQDKALQAHLGRQKKNINIPQYYTFIPFDQKYISGQTSNLAAYKSSRSRNVLKIVASATGTAVYKILTTRLAALWFHLLTPHFA